MREIASRLLLFGMSMCVCVLIVEGCIRLFNIEETHFYQMHPVTGWALVPDRTGWRETPNNRVWININSKGLRDRDYGYQKKSDVYRILSLGDSFTEAMQVPLEQAFHSQLETSLNMSGNGRYEVINAGVASFGTSNQLLFYRDEGKKYDPDLVMLAFYIGNDVKDNDYKMKGEGSPYFYMQDGELVLKNYPYSTRGGSVKNFLHKNSNAYHLVKRALWQGPPGLLSWMKKVGLVHKSGTAIDTEGVYGVPTSHLFWSNNWRDSTDWKRAWEITRALLAQLHRETAAHGTKLMVVIIPAAIQVYEIEWAKVMGAYPTDEWHSQVPNSILTDCLEEEGIIYLDLLPYFMKARRSDVIDQFYGLPKDGHWNSGGHEIAAKAIYQYLETESLLPVD